MKPVFYLSPMVSLFIAMSLSAESLPLCEIYAHTTARFFPDGKVSLLRPIEFFREPHVGYQTRYVWESVDVDTGERQELSRLVVPTTNGEGTFDISPDGNYAIYHDGLIGAYQLNKGSDAFEIPIIKSFLNARALAFKPNSQAMILTEAYEQTTVTRLVLIEQDSPGSQSWHLIDEVRHTFNQTCFELAISVDANNKLIGLCGRKDGTYSVVLENNKIKFTRITPATFNKLASVKSKTVPTFFGYESFANPKMKRLVFVDGTWQIEEIADSRDYNTSEWDALPGTFIVVNEDELIFTFDGQWPLIAKRLGAEWSVDALTTPLDISPLDTMNNPLRYLHIGTVQNPNSIDQNGIIISEKTSSGWFRKELSPGPLSITKRICDWNERALF